jgi:hypothetical protein
VEGHGGEVLLAARDRVHRGYRLLSHPLYGNLRPHHQPFRTVLLDGPGVGVDYQSILLMEEALEVYRPFMDLQEPSRFPFHQDLAYVDLKLIENTLDAYGL